MSVCMLKGEIKDGCVVTITHNKEADDLTITAEKTEVGDAPAPAPASAYF
jgi:hypothetical protein